MPEFFLELFSEEMPAGVQATATSELFGICENVFAQLGMRSARGFHGPRRIAISAIINAERPGKTEEIRGPRENAPEAALKGFLNKYSASAADVVGENGYYVLKMKQEKTSAQEIIRQELVLPLAKLKWRKSMRWEDSGNFSWIRPLRRIVCLLDGEIIPIKLGSTSASNETEGHRSVHTGPLIVSSADDWQRKLFTHQVVAASDDRQRRIEVGFREHLDSLGLSLVDDDDLLIEVTGLVEWPVPLIGKIEKQFMELPPEVRELSMKVNQKYFATRDATGRPAPYFAFVANLEAPDAGAAIIAGNERVLRARLSDARHFWDRDTQEILTTKLEDVTGRLKKVIFHAKLGTQYDRVIRLQTLAIEITRSLGGDENQIENANAAALFCKADLVSLMVGEFPELQGIIGGYYAGRMIEYWTPGEEIDPEVVSQAIRTHYQPKGPRDEVPNGIVAISVALADKFDTLRKFFEIDEGPTGSGDPYALRRAALGVIRIILENGLRLPLMPLLGSGDSLFNFIVERLRAKLRAEGRRFDVLDAVLGAGSDDDLVRLMKRVEALGAMLGTDEGRNLHAAYKRAANILKIEDARDGPHNGEVNPRLFERCDLELDHAILMAAGPQGLFSHGIATEDFVLAVQGLSLLRPYIESFFDKATVNAPDPAVRRNRLALLARFRDTVHQIADFSKLEG